MARGRARLPPFLSLNGTHAVCSSRVPRGAGRSLMGRAPAAFGLARRGLRPAGARVWSDSTEGVEPEVGMTSTPPHRRGGRRGRQLEAPHRGRSPQGEQHVCCARRRRGSAGAGSLPVQPHRPEGAGERLRFGPLGRAAAGPRRRGRGGRPRPALRPPGSCPQAASARTTSSRSSFPAQISPRPSKVPGLISRRATLRPFRRRSGRIRGT